MFRKLAWKKNAVTVGLEVQAEGIALVCRDSRPGKTTQDDSYFGQIHLKDLATFRDGDLAACSAPLKKWVVQNKLQGTACNVVLGTGQYQLLLVEPPEVKEEEMRSAIRWRLKDLLTTDVEKAVIDVFHLPEDGTRNNKKMLYVVAADEQIIQSIINLVAEVGLRLQSIDIGELAMRNLATALLCDDSGDRGVAIARLYPGSGSVFLYRKGSMYLSRNFDLAYNGGLLDELPVESLGLELQRSLDYYERQLRQAPPAVIYLCGENLSEDKINTGLRTNLAVQVQHLDPAAIVDIAERCDPGLLQSCVGAIGGALRREG